MSLSYGYGTDARELFIYSNRTTAMSQPTEENYNWIIELEIDLIWKFNSYDISWEKLADYSPLIIKLMIARLFETIH